jgi:hypothetical protein
VSKREPTASAIHHLNNTIEQQCCRENNALSNMFFMHEVSVLITTSVDRISGRISESEGESESVTEEKTML